MVRPALTGAWLVQRTASEIAETARSMSVVEMSRWVTARTRVASTWLSSTRLATFSTSARESLTSNTTIFVSTAPGSSVTPEIAASPSTGVGLANIRDRLSQAYGPAHRFETRKNERGGFSVIIEIPYETGDKA